MQIVRSKKRRGDSIGPSPSHCRQRRQTGRRDPGSVSQGVPTAVSQRSRLARNRGNCRESAFGLPADLSRSAAVRIGSSGRDVRDRGAHVEAAAEHPGLASNIRKRSTSERGGGRRTVSEPMPGISCHGFPQERVCDASSNPLREQSRASRRGVAVHPDASAASISSEGRVLLDGTSSAVRT